MSELRAAPGGQRDPDRREECAQPEESHAPPAFEQGRA
jgi:hypothetical protein